MPSDNRIARTEAYAKKIEQQFSATVNDIVALNKVIPKLPTGQMFSFADLSPQQRAEVERLLRRLHASATMTIQKGMRAEWSIANSEVDKMLVGLFGKKALGSEAFSAALDRNSAAMEAFIHRSDNGMNLSSRVWKSVNQLRDEMEVAMTVGIGSGTAASTNALATDVRKCLANPDSMYRRFRYKDEEGNWQSRWKKKYIDDEGHVRFKDVTPDDAEYHPGTGVYRSSAKNAMRMARTETNMAYRRADFERWNRMDFVRGVRIELSKNHPMPDICNDLAGDYPKGFYFSGWHPQCFCHAVPIMQTEAEMDRMLEAYKNGKGAEYEFSRKNIETLPSNFRGWVKDNAGKINTASSLPYFIRDNFTQQKGKSLAKSILGATFETETEKKVLQPSIVDIAAQRHAARTQEQIKDIQDAWNRRTLGITEQDLSKIISDNERQSIAVVLKSNTTSRKHTLEYILNEALKDEKLSTIKRAASRFDSNVIKRLYSKFLSASSVTDRYILMNELKAKCAIKTRWELRKAGAVSEIADSSNNKMQQMKYVGIKVNHVIYKGKTLPIKNGKSVKVDSLIEDLVEYVDKNGKHYYYPIDTDASAITEKATDISKLINKAPKYIKENCTGFIMTDMAHPLDAYFKKVYKNFSKGYMYSGEPITIHSTASSRDYFEFSICHEVGHHIDRKGNYSSSSDWRDAQKSDNCYYREYSKQAATEDFADTIGYLTKNGKAATEQKFPARYKLLKTILKL